MALTPSCRYFIITNLAKEESDVIRYAALLRGTESAWQALSYGLTAVKVIGQVGGVYLNFGLWGIAILPAWLVLRHFGADNAAAEKDSETAQTADSKPLEAGSEEEIKGEAEVKMTQA